jgi:hypothetical protein
MARSVRRNEEEMWRLVAEYEASRETRRRFARERGISVAKLDYHRRRLAAAEEAPRLLPVDGRRSR